ncbi:peroxiredoxin [Dactylosporangium sp. NPDC005572]|uniref:peroxiredoxin n=1 Tax=Dactylosporangium sp. NPDC005572 TaxID=3156889 RepID=UPI00339DCFD4
MTLDVGKPALAVGASAPDFTLRDQNNQEVSLRDLLSAGRAVLLVFYPLAFTGTCQGELHAVRDNLSAFQNPRVQVLTVSVDSPYAHKVWADREGYDFPLLSDFWPHGAVARAYGVFNEKAGFANRGTFLVDASGVVRFAEVQGPGKAREQAGWLAAIEAL